MLLTAKATAAATETNPCELPAQGGYRSLENHLYRVEVHLGGDSSAGNVLVKWSRDNAIHRTRLLDVADSSLVVEEVGKDDATALAAGDWVEVRDEGRTLRGEPGFFVEVGEVVGTRLGIRTILDPVTQQPLVQNSRPDAAVLPKQGLVRRWEGGAPVTIALNQVIKLERGIEIQLAPATGHADVGDYWLIPARSLSAAIEWPVDAASSGGAALPPHGITHTYCPLAIVQKTDVGWVVKDDCRPIFPPLTKLRPELVPLGGDGQPLCAGKPAPGPLVVGLFWGKQPLKGINVTFKVLAGDATVAPQFVTTDDQGLAQTTLTAGVDTSDNNGVVRVEAVADAPIAMVPKVLEFGARFLDAQCVYVGSSICPDGQQATNSNTVAALIDFLCARGGGGRPDPGIRVVGILRAKTANNPPNIPINAYEVLAPEILARGLLFEIDGPVDKASLALGQAGHVAIDLPFPVEQSAIQLWWQQNLQPREAVFGSSAIKLSGELTAADSVHGPQHGVLWMPAGSTIKWLTDWIARVFERLQLPFRVPAQAILHGHRIYSVEDQPRYLAGDLYLHDTQVNGVQYASDDGCKGGDLALPFFVGRLG